MQAIIFLPRSSRKIKVTAELKRGGVQASGQRVPIRAEPGQVAEGASRPVRLTLQFTGTGAEYFGIWIMNLFLILVTLGLFYPWAKVRKNRYLYGHTRLAGDGFEYLADPFALLKGMLIVVLLLAVNEGLSLYFPGASYVTSSLFLVGLPWLIWKAIRFRAVNSGWRNMRYGFTGNLGRCYRVFFLLSSAWGLLLILAITLISFEVIEQPEADPLSEQIGLIGWTSIGIAAGVLFYLVFVYPLYVQQSWRYLLGNLHYGAARFHCRARPLPFYGAYWPGLLLFAVGTFAVLAAAFYSLFISILAGDPSLSVAGLLVLLQAALTVWIAAYVHVHFFNLAWNSTRLENNQFFSTMRVWPLMKIRFVNLCAIIVSLGLLVPWTVCRELRYRLENLHVELEQDLDSFMAGAGSKVGALGEQFSEAMDLGVDI